MQGKVVLLTGVPASGKSTLAKSIEESETLIRRISFGHLLFELKKKNYPNLRYEELRSRSAEIITPEDVALLDILLVEKVTEWRTETNIIIDSHAVTREQYGFRITAFNQDLLTELAPDAIIVLSLAPEELHNRIRTRNEGRIETSIKDIAHHASLQESLAVVYGVVCGCPVFVLEANRSTEELTSSALKILKT